MAPTPTRMIEALKSLLLPRYDVELTIAGASRSSHHNSKTARLVRLDRSFCRHTSMKRVSGAKFLAERQAVRLKARATAPFHNSEFAILWGTERISIFYWDRDRINAELRSRGAVLAEGAVILPSNFFEPAGRNVELRSHAEGVELQVWDGGALQLSRWWQTPPTPDQISTLLQSLELGLEEIQTAPLTPIARSREPIRLAWRNIPEYVLLFRPHLITLALATNLIVAAFAVGGYLVVWQQQADFASRQSAIAPQEMQVIEARKQAIANERWIETYESVRGYRQHLPVLEAFLDAIAAPANRLTMDSWEYENGRLVVTLKVNGEVDVRKLVKALESHRLFKGVNSETNALQNNLKMSMTVVPGGK